MERRVLVSSGSFLTACETGWLAPTQAGGVALGVGGGAVDARDGRSGPSVCLTVDLCRAVDVVSLDCAVPEDGAVEWFPGPLPVDAVRLVTAFRSGDRAALDALLGTLACAVRPSAPIVVGDEPPLVAVDGGWLADVARPAALPAQLDRVAGSLAAVRAGLSVGGLRGGPGVGAEPAWLDDSWRADFWREGVFRDAVRGVMAGGAASVKSLPRALASRGLHGELWATWLWAVGERRSPPASGEWSDEARAVGLGVALAPDELLARGGGSLGAAVLFGAIAFSGLVRGYAALPSAVKVDAEARESVMRSALGWLGGLDHGMDAPSPGIGR